MEWLGLFSFIVMIGFMSYPSRVNNIEKKLKKLERGQEEDLLMSKIISDLVGKECTIETEEFGTEQKCKVIDVDEEWIKFTYQDKKSGLKTRIIRIDSIDNIEVIS